MAQLNAEKQKLYEGTVFTSLGNLFLLFGNPLVQGTVIRLGSLITLTSEPPNRLPGVTKFRGLESLCSRQCNVFIIYPFISESSNSCYTNYGEFFCSIIVFIKNMFTHLQTSLFIEKKLLKFCTSLFLSPIIV